MPHIRGDPRAGHPTEEERRIMEARAGQVPARPGTQAPSSSDPWGLLGLQIAADNPFLEFMRTPIGALGIRPEQYFDPMLTALRYIDRAVRTSGLPIGSVLPMTGVLGPRAMIEAPGEQVEAFKAFLEPAMRGDWDAAIAAYQDEITPTLPWQDPGSKIPGYWGAMEIPAAFVPTGGPFLAGSKVVSSAPSIARSVAKLAPAAARPAVYRGVRQGVQPVGKAMMAPWQLENLAGEMAMRGAVKGVKGVGSGAGWLGGRARRGAAEAAVRVPGGGELGLKIAGVQPVAGGSGTPFYREVREKVIEKFTDPNLQTQFLDMQKQFTDMGLGFDAVSVGQRGDEFFLSVSRPRIKAKINEVIDKTSNDPGIGEGVRHWIRTSEPYFGVEKKKSFRSNNLYFNNFDDLRNWLRKGEYKSPEILGTTLRPGEVVEPLYELGKATQRRPSWILPPISKRKQKFTEERMRKLEKDIEEYNLQQEGLGVEPVGETPIPPTAPTPTARVSGLTPDEVNKLDLLKGQVASDEAALNDLLTDAEYMTRFATRGVKPRPYTVRYPGRLPGDEGYRPPTKLVYTKSERLKNIKDAEDAVTAAKSDVDTVKKEISDEKASAKQAGEAPDPEDMADLNQQLSDARDALSDARDELKVAKQSTAYTAKEKAYIAAADKLDVEYPRDLRVRIKSGQQQIAELEARQVAGVTTTTPPTAVPKVTPTPAPVVKAGTLPEGVVEIPTTPVVKGPYKIGNVAIAEGGQLRSVHVTSDPSRLEKVLRTGGDISQTREPGLVGDLGTAGIYFSNTPQLWTGRAAAKWSFLTEINQSQSTRLGELLEQEIRRLRSINYITASEEETALRYISDFKANPTFSGGVEQIADQPYNVAFWKPEFLSRIGIEQLRPPVEVPIVLRGRFADISDVPSTRRTDVVAALKEQGFDGALYQGHIMGDSPQGVVWNSQAIEQFGKVKLRTTAPIVEVSEQVIPEVEVGTKTGPDVREVNLGKISEEEAQDLVDRYATWENLVDDFKKASSEKVNPDKASPTGIGAGDPPSVGTGGIPGEGLPVNSSGNNTLPPSPTLGFLIENMFREDVWRRIANLPIMKQFLQNSPWFSNPAGVANSPADKFLVLRATYRYYADQKAELLISRVKQLGSEESIWGKMDDTGKLTEGPFEGMFLNDIRTQRYKFENRMTPEMKTWINAMEELEAAKLQYLKDNNIPIHELKFEEGGVYAGRRVVGKIGRDGKVKDTAIIGKRPGAKLPSERQRWYTTQAEAVEKGFRYMSETDALYLNIKGAYRRVDDQNLVEWFLNQPGISYRHISTSFGVPELNIVYKAEVRRLNAAKDLQEQINAIGGERITGQQIRGIKKYFPEEAERLKQLSADIHAGKETAAELKSLKADVELLIENRKAVAKDAEVKLLEAKGKAAKVKQGEYTVSAPAFNDIIFTGDDAFNLSSALNKQFAGDYNAVLASVNKVNALLRFFQLAGDASIFGIHLIFMAGRPDIFLRSGVAFVKALFDPTFASKQKRNIPQELLDKHPGIQWVSGGSNEITEALGTGGLLMEKPFKLLGAPLQPFARGFESALDTAGIELMKSLDRYATTPQRAYEVDDFINKFRGLARSDRLGVTETNRAIENATFLASSYNRSIAALLFDVFHGGMSGHLARVNLARGVTAVSAMTVVVGYSMGDSTKQVIDRLNPRSPNFMTWNVGGTRIGPGSKVRSVLKLLADTAKDPGSLMEKSMENPGLRFLRGNLAPVASDGLDILVGSTYIGDPIDTPAAFGKEILAPALMPIWVQSTVLEGGTFGERLTRGGVEFLGGRAYPASPLRETARKKYGMDYNDLEYYQKDEVREDEEVQEYFREQENKTGVKNRYFSHLNAYDAEHIAKMNSYVSDYRGDKNAIRNAYYSNLQFYRGAKDAVKRALEPGFKEPDIDDKDLGERALAERFELFDNPRIKSSTGNIIWDNYDAALSRLEAKWARQTRIDPQTGQRESVLYYVRRNTNLTPVPSGLLPYLAESTRTNIYRSKAARIKHQRDIAPAPQPVKETDRRVTFPFGKDLEPMESYITFTVPPRGTVPVGR